MFSGIIESQVRIVSAANDGGLVRVEVERPVDFDDIKIGDSISFNGVCLTVERVDSKRIAFALADETLRVTGWSAQSLQGNVVNLERSLRFGDRIHGHLVSGHVDGVGQVVSTQDLRGALQLNIRIPPALGPFVWRKGSLAVNGTSLTINDVDNDTLSVCLIPETLKRTNLGNLPAGARVNLEVDMMARGLIESMGKRGLHEHNC